MNRRSFVGHSVLAAASLSRFRPFMRVGSPSLRVLVLGGTGFLGPAVVEAAVELGHTVTLFNRGITNPGLFPFLEHLHGFRSPNPEDQDLSALATRRFDVVIDVWPHDPAMVAATAEYLRPRTRQYLFVSSIAAYDAREFERPGIEETAPLEPWNGPGPAYNRGKAECERRLHARYGDAVTVVRPGPIKGDRDTTPDLYTWLVRAANGGRHIAPGDGDDRVEFVDAKDVGRFLMLSIDRSLLGTYNLTGTAIRFRDFLAICRNVTRSTADFVWIPQDFLRAHGLETDQVLGIFGGNFPLWRPPDAHPGLYQVSSAKAFRAGWHTRPREETALDCLGYFRSLGERLEWTDYLTAAKEREVLAAWEQRAKTG